jgi:hypothetical protein
MPAITKSNKTNKRINMRDKHQTDIIADITFLASDKDAPGEIRITANSALTAYAIAVKTASNSRTDQIDIAADLDLFDARTAKDLADDLINGKSISIDRAADKISKLVDKKHRADHIYKIAQRLQAIALSNCGRVLRDHRTDLILWCARKRNADLTRCGEILPDPVWRIWQTLGVRFYRLDDPTLNLDAWRINGKQLKPLPIEWYDTWSDTSRASLAWIYQQLASGNFVIHKNGNDDLVRLTQTPYELPQVPRAKPTPKTSTVNWA